MSDATLHRRQVVAAVQGFKAGGVTLRRLLDTLTPAGASREARRAVEGLLAEAEERGEVVRSSSGRYVAVEHSDHFVGTLRMTAKGFGVVRLGERDLPDIVVPPAKLGTALDGDFVLVLPATRRSKGQLRRERFGEIVRVLRRRRPTIVGRYRRHAVQPWVEPFARRLTMQVLVDRPAGGEPEEGEFVEVAAESASDDRPVRGRLLRRLGSVGESGVDEEVVLAELAIPVEFPPAALREAEDLPAEVRPEDLGGRTDFRHHPVVTIDGESAKDFDDAVVAFSSGDDIEVFVHIADVAAYVAEGEPLDLAARERGTSVYLPARCVPMLPEKLSNGLCSLRPATDRLVFSVRFLVKPDGAVEGYRAERGVIHSRRRCTYTEVFGWLDTGAWPELPEGVRGSLLLLAEAARRIGERRARRGSIDFDLPEPEILLDPEGFMTGVVAGERNTAHRLIEELMVAANECVARLLVWGRQQGLFRIHEKPSVAKLAELQAVLEEFGYVLRGDLEQLPPAELQRLLAEIHGKPEERFLNTLILRSLARASYSPECRGHYALATEFYLHFTSPIRRYPDLVVHRRLAELLSRRLRQGTERDLLAAELEDLAQHCSLTERRADEAEREVVRWKQVDFMRARVGEEFAGHVTGVVAFGYFVQLAEVFVEGLVHVSDLHDDFYRYDEQAHRLVGERFGRTIRLGDEVRVRVKGINEEFMEINLEPVLPPLAPGAERSARGTRRPRPAPPHRPERQVTRKTPRRPPRSRR